MVREQFNAARLGFQPGVATHHLFSVLVPALSIARKDAAVLFLAKIVDAGAKLRFGQRTGKKALICARIVFHKLMVGESIER